MVWTLTGICCDWKRMFCDWKRMCCDWKRTVETLPLGYRNGTMGRVHH